MVDVTDFEVVLVTYHSRALVEGLLAGLPRELPVVLVDNAQGADAIHELLDGRPHGRYVKGAGQGFARAANLGALTSEKPYVVFVNPDTRVEVGQLRALVDDLLADESLAAVAATTITPEGKVELGVGGWEPTLRRTFVYAAGLHAWFPEGGLYARPEPHRPVELEWLTGACLAVPRATFASLGGFDESFFLYNEDMAYGRRLRDAGLRQRLRTDILVPHAGAGSGGSKLRMLQMRGASMYDYLRQHNRSSSAHAMRLVLSAGALGRGAVSRARGRKDAAQGFTAYARGLWRGAPDMT